MRPHRLAILVFSTAICLRAVPAGAHEFWLAPSSYHPAPGTGIEVHAFTGDGFRGEPKVYAPERVVRLVARADARLDVSRVADPGANAWVRFAPVDSGGAMLAYESNFASLALPAARFDAYLEEEGHDDALAARRRTKDTRDGRERYRRCAKAWLGGRDPRRATEPIGLPLEIVPRGIPGAASKLRVRVLLHGKGLANALVRAWRSPFAAEDLTLDAATRDSTGIVAERRTDSRGEVELDVRESGEWLVAVSHMARCRDAREADWESTWASLTFGRHEDARRPSIE